MYNIQKNGAIRLKHTHDIEHTMKCNKRYKAFLALGYNLQKWTMQLLFSCIASPTNFLGLSGNLQRPSTVWS